MDIEQKYKMAIEALLGVVERWKKNKIEFDDLDFEEGYEDGLRDAAVIAQEALQKLGLG